MLLRTKLITTAIATTTAVIGGIAYLDFNGEVLSTAVDKNEQANKAAIEAIGQAKTTIENENKKIGDLSSAIATLNGQIDGLEKELEAAKASGVTDKETINNLENQIDTAEKAKQELQDQIDAAEKAKQAAEEAAKKALEEAEKANQEADKAEAKADAAQEAADKAQEAADKAKAENAENAKDLQDKADQAKEEANQAKVEAEKANQEAIDATSKANEYYQAYRYEYEQVAKANEFVKEQAARITGATDNLNAEIKSLNDLINSDKTQNALETPINNGQTTK